MIFKAFFCRFIITCVIFNLGCSNHTSLKNIERNNCSLYEWSFSVYESFWEVDPRFKGISYIKISQNESKDLEDYLKKMWSSAKDYDQSSPISSFFDKNTGSLISFMSENEGPISIDTNNGVYFSLKIIPDDKFLITIGDNNERRLSAIQFQELCNTLYDFAMKEKRNFH